MNTQNKTITFRACSYSEIADMAMESISDLHAYVKARGYQLSGDLPKRETLIASLQDSSYSKRKHLIKAHFSLRRKCTMRSANRFFHLLCVKVLAYHSEEQVPRIDYSEKENGIRSARADWVKARDEAEALRLAYTTEKGDFYKT